MPEFESSTQTVPATGEVPRHVAIIMDGNGRWAKKRFLPRVGGHRKGVEAVRETVKACSELGVEYLTLFAFSAVTYAAARGKARKLAASPVRAHSRPGQHAALVAVWTAVPAFLLLVALAGFGGRVQTSLTTENAPAAVAALPEAQRVQLIADAVATAQGRAVSAVNYGGAIKPAFDATVALAKSYGDFITSLGGLYSCGPDMNTSEHDMDTIAERCPYVFCRTVENRRRAGGIMATVLTASAMARSSEGISGSAGVSMQVRTSCSQNWTRAGVGSRCRGLQPVGLPDSSAK